VGYFDDYVRSEAPGVRHEQLTAVHVNVPAAKVVAPDKDGFLDGEALPAAAGFVGDILAQPPCAMTVTLVCSGTQTGKATIYGEDIGDNEIEEEVTLTSDTPVESTKAFSKVTKLKLPIKVASETIDVGWGGKFGLPFKVATAGLVLVTLFDGATDTGTVTANATDLAKNVYEPDGTPDGEKAIDLYILV
jgi:hypothetical protein